jgi:hypothetical protein
MMKRVYKKTLFLFAAIIIISGCNAVFPALVCGDDGQSAVNPQSANDRTETQHKKSPLIIWFYNGYGDTPESLTTALSSGLISHVMISYMHRADVNWSEKPSVLKAIAVTKKSGAKLIWSRNLWPYYNNTGIHPELLFDPNYYIREIRNLRFEAEQMGADYVAFDTEPYAYSPMKVYKERKKILKTEDIQRIELVIREVVKKEGKVDFVYPGGSEGKTMPYNSLAELAKYRISESTYYANYPRIKGLRSPYEIFGAYVNTEPGNPGHPKSPLFTIRQVFEDSWLWSQKDGLFIYPKEGRSLEVARALVAYARSLPKVSIIKETDGNNPK